MLLTIHDANLQKVAFIDNEKQSTLNYYDDTWTRNLETGSSTFEFTVFKKAIQSDTTRQKTYNYLNEKAFVSFKYNGKSYVFSVMTVEENEQTITCYCENLNLELINEYANPYKATKAMSFVEYCNAMDLLNFTHLSVGINEISDQKRTLEWEGRDTKLARLLSLAKKFDAEIDFDTQLNADSSIKFFKVNVYHENDDKHQGVGRVRNDIQLTYGKNLKSITRKIDKTGIYTMVRPYGKKTNGENETIISIGNLSAWSENNADGVREFYQSGDGLYAPLAAQMYPSTFTSGTQADQWIRKDLEVDSDNPTVIRAAGIANLKKNAYPAITYDVDGFIDVDVGDTVKIYDDGFSPILLVKARVSDQKISFTNPNSNKTTFANFKALENNLSDGIQAAFERLFEASKPYLIKLSTDNGVVFKNQEGETVVTPKLYKGGQPSASSVVWNWTLDGVTTTGMTYTVRGADVTDTATLTIAAYIGNDEVAVDEISFVNVLDGTMGTPGTPGKDGRTPYVHTAWANNSTGTSGFSLDSSVNKLYIGIYTDFEPADSQDPARYKWTLIKGEKGDKGDDGVAGKDGIGIDSTVITYASSSSGTSAPTTGWGGTVPTVPAGNYLWTKTVWNYSDGISETGYSVARIGKDGNTGADGIAGKDGVGIKTTTITYAKSTNGTTAPTSGWTTSVPIAVDGDYIWTKTVWVYTDNTTETGYSVGKIGNTGSKGDKGADGVPGKDGVGIKSTAITYGLSTSDSVQPINWTTTVPNLVKGQYLWTKTVWTYSDSTNETGYTKTYIAKDGNNGTDGIAGKDGVGIKTTTITYAKSTNGTTAPTSGWTTSVPIAVDGDYIWTKTVWVYTDNTTETGYSVGKIGNTGSKGDKGADGVPGKDGVGIKSTAITYGLSTSDSVQPINWTTTVPNLVKGQYLWTKTVWTYSDSTNETGYTKTYIAKDGNNGTDGIAGKDGVGIKTTTITYAKSTNGTTAPTSGWTTSVPIAVDGDYIWTKTVWVYTDNTTETGYSVGKIGNTGSKGDKGADGVPGKDGVGIKSTAITYGLSTSDSVQPINWTTTVPNLVKGQYLWTKTVWTYSDSTNETGYTKTYIAKDGNNGTDGIAGKDGVGIKTTTITYAKSTNGTTAPTSGWTTSVPIAVDGDYIWTKTVWVYTDNTTETGYSVGKIGNTGSKGDKGADGVPGKDGVGIKSTAITYGLSTSDSVQPINWTTTVPNLVKGQYLWTKTVWTYSDSTNETGYTKTYIAKDGNNGTDGIAGKDGVGIKTTTITYAKSTNGTTAPTSGWTTSVPIAVDGDYIWTKTVWVYTDNTTETGYSVGKIGNTGSKGDKGADGVPGKDGVGIKSTAITYASSSSGTSAPTTGWGGTVPTVPAGNYLWTKTVWNYSDGISETGYSVARIGKDGNTGADGIAGKDGVGIVSTTITYGRSTSGTSNAGITWTSSVPNVPSGEFLWTKTVWNYSDQTSETGYSVAKMGEKGDKGLPGPKGADGRTPYVHWAYSDNADGTGLTLTDNGQRYIGQYSDYTQADSTDKTKYTWADRWAKIEVGGRNIIRNSAFGNATNSGPSFTVGGVTYPAKSIPNWNNLYNSGIPNPTTSYHAIYKESFEGKGPVIEFNESNGSRNWKAINTILRASELSFGNYTFSADIYATGTGTKIWFGFYYYNKSGVRNFHSGQTTVYITTINKWNRVAGQIKLNDDIDLSKEVNFYIYAYGFTTNSILYLTKPQLEEGIIPTPYGEAQSDIDERIDTKANKEKVVYKTDISVTDEGIVHSASKTVNGQTIASMIAQRAEWVEIIARLLKVKGDMIVDGTIGANKLSVNTLSALTADLGKISGGSLELLKSVAQATSVDVWGNFTIPAHKWGLYIDNIGVISSGTPVRKSSSESTASDMPVAVLTSGQLRFARVNQNNDLGSVLNYGLSDPDNGTISFVVAQDGTKQLLIQANGQIVNQGTNYTGWISTGETGVHYKRHGDVVALKMQVKTTANQTYGLGKIPVALLPIPNNGTMMRVTSWTADHSIGRNLQINPDGSMVLLPSNRGDTINTQVTWII